MKTQPKKTVVIIESSYEDTSNTDSSDIIFYNYRH